MCKLNGLPDVGAPDHQRIRQREKFIKLPKRIFDFEEFIWMWKCSEMRSRKTKCFEMHIYCWLGQVWMIDQHKTLAMADFMDAITLIFFYCAKVMRIEMSHMKMEYLSVNSSIYDKIRILCARRSGHKKHFRFAQLCAITSPMWYKLIYSVRVWVRAFTRGFSLK